MDGVKVVIVDDHEMVVDALVAALGVEDGLEVIATASSVAEFAGLLDELVADVVVTDWHLQDGTGADIASTALSALPDVGVLMISGFRDEATVTAAIEAGCSGFISKGAEVADLVGAIRTVAGGTAVFPASLLGQLTRRRREGPKGDALTEREHEVLALLAEAISVDDIAEQLELSVHTVRNHVRSILTKLHARSQLEAVVEGVRSGLVQVG